MKHFLLIDIDPEHIPLIADRIEHFCQRAGMNLEDSFKVKICATEAINNAVEHAYHFSRGNIDIDLCIEGNEIVVKISNDVPVAADSFSTVAEPDPGNERGRGWQIIEAWSDRSCVCRSEARTTVRLYKRICN